MHGDRSRLHALREEVLAGKLNRRDVLRRGAALGLSAPVIASLLAACGGGDDSETTDEQPTEPADEGAAQDEPTATPAEEGGEATEEPTAEATESGGEATPTTGEEGSGGGTSIDAGDRMMGKELEDAASEGGVLIEGGFSDLSTVNPILVNDVPSGNFTALIFESLMQPNPDTLEPVGLLADSWTISEDGLTWTVTLHEGITWHDGETLTAEDVKFTYDLHMTEAAASPRYSDFTSKIESVEVIDETTVAFNLQLALADFPLDLGVYGIIAQHVWQDIDPATLADDPGSTGEDPARVVGTGPFRFEQWIIEDRATAVPYPDYWQGTPHIEQFIYKYVPDQSAVVQQLRTGEIDWSDGGVPEVSVPDFEGTDIGIYDYPTLDFTFYGTNLDEEVTTLFQDANVRKALLYALDREAMIESIRFGYGEVAVGTMPTLSWAYNPDDIENTFPYDPDQAMQLLEDAGWTEGDDGVRQKDGQRLAFSMYTNAGNQVREDYLTTMQEFWRQIGVEMTPQLEPFPALVERITQTFDFEVVLIGFSWSATPDQSAMWACDSYPQGFNLVKYCNEEVDSILTEALTEQDQERRVELYTEFQNVLLNDLPMAVLDFPRGISGLHNRVHNLFPNDVNDRFNAHTWWLES